MLKYICAMTTSGLPYPREEVLPYLVEQKHVPQLVH